jgi:hypothetical protein
MKGTSPAIRPGAHELAVVLFCHDAEVSRVKDAVLTRRDPDGSTGP